MRILLLIKGLGRGGAEQLLASAGPHLARERFDYEVAYLLPWKDALVKDLERHSVSVHCLDGARGLGWVGRLRALVRKRGIDLVHVHSPVVASVARVSLGGTRIVSTEHNVWPRYHPATYWANAVTFPRNDHVFAVSEEVRRSIRYPRPLRSLRLPPVETLHHGIDLPQVLRWSEADGIRDELAVPDGAPLIGTVGNFKSYKGQEHLLRAAALILREVPKARFLLVGLGQLLGRARAEAERLTVSDAVIFTGFRDDAPSIAAALDVFVQPSEYEGLPIALLEAMALGRPVVATRVGGTPEVVEDGVNGLLVPPRNPRALAEAILRLLGDKGLRSRLGEAARRRAAEFDIRRAVRRQEEVYEELLS